MRGTLTPVQGPDGRVYYNLDEVADLIEAHEGRSWGKIRPEERKFWSDLLREIGKQAAAHARAQAEGKRGRFS